MALAKLPAPGKVTLAGIVGTAVALALGYATPAEESGRKVNASIGGSGELVIKHISGKQYLNAYLDIVNVATACDGLTSYRGRKITIRDKFTEAQCATMLEEELIVHAKGVMSCTPGLALKTGTDELRRQGPRFASVSLAYNVGIAGYCTSTANKRFNAFDYPGGCTALTWFNKAGGRVNTGLVNRRKRENYVCVNGLGALGKVYR